MTYAALAASDFLTGGVSLGVTGGGVWFVLSQILKVQRLFMDRYAKEITDLAAKNLTLQVRAERGETLAFGRGMALVQFASEVDDLRARLRLPDLRAQHRVMLAELELVHPQHADPIGGPHA